MKRPKDKNEQERTELLLSLTSSSIFRQEREDFLVYICGHVKPDSVLKNFPDVKYIEAPFPAPEPHDGSEAQRAQKFEEYKLDKHRKRAIIADEIKQYGPLYYAAIDADDLIHRKFVEYVLKSDNKAGHYVGDGYVLDIRENSLAPIPGVWRRPFYQLCGSSAVVYLDENDFPKMPWTDPRWASDKSLFSKTQSHTRVIDNMNRVGRAMTPFPFRGAVYVMNTGSNISYEVGEGNFRQSSLTERIRSMSVENVEQNLHRYVDLKLYRSVREEMARL